MKCVSNGAKEKGKAFVYSHNSLQCGYLKIQSYHWKGFNIIQFQRVKYVDIRWNPHLPSVKHHVLKIDPTNLPNNR